LTNLETRPVGKWRPDTISIVLENVDDERVSIHFSFSPQLPKEDFDIDLEAPNVFVFDQITDFLKDLFEVGSEHGTNKIMVH
jgi:hypothetical protein